MTNPVQKFEWLGLVLIFGTSCLACASHELRSIDPELQKAIDDFVNFVYFPVSNITKLGLAIVKNDSEILYSTGYGMADERKGIPNGNQTQFLIGSITKSFTATVVIKVLYERFPEMGETVLDTPVMKLMQSTVNITLIDRYRTEHFTFRDLLAHRMCIFRDDLQLFSEPFLETSEIVYRQRYAEEICGMRSEFKYNSQMYVIAGELAGILANKSYTQLLKDLMEEIGMHNSGLLDKSDDFSKMPNRAQPYYVLNSTSYPLNPELLKRVVVSNAAGGLYAPPHDMIKYMNFHLNKGKVEGRQIIPQDVISWLTRPSIHMSQILHRASEKGPLIAPQGYGLGMILASYEGWEYNFHNGYFPPYKSMMSLFPSHNLGIFTSSNEGPAYVDSLVIHAFVFEILRGSSSTEAIEKLGKIWKNVDAIRIAQEQLRDQVLEKFLLDHKGEPIIENESVTGNYGSGGSGDTKILIKSNPETNTTGLYVMYGKWYRGWMENVGGPVYKITWDTDVVQDSYCSGDPKGFGYASVANKTLQFYLPGLDKVHSLGKFKLDVSLHSLPAIPWDANSC